MFLEEARIAAQLEHPNVGADVRDRRGRHPSLHRDGVSRRREPVAVAPALNKTGGIPLRTSLTILMHVLEGLDYAHQARRPRRQAAQGRPSRSVAVEHHRHRARRREDPRLRHREGRPTATASRRPASYSGKLSYMPPEQMRGDTRRRARRPLRVRRDPRGGRARRKVLGHGAERGRRARSSATTSPVLDRARRSIRCCARSASARSRRIATSATRRRRAQEPTSRVPRGHRRSGVAARARTVRADDRRGRSNEAARRRSIRSSRG